MILVTGATGTVGSELVRQLSARGVRVRALARNPEKARGLQGPGVEIVRGDLGDPASLDQAMKGVERVFVLSSVDSRQAELQGNAVKAAQRAGVRHLVKVGAAGTSLDSPIAVARMHAQTEQQIVASGIPWTFLQPRLFMHFLLGNAATIKTQGAFYAPLRDGKVSMIDARDIAAVAGSVLTSSGHEGKTYELTGPEALSFADAAQRLSTVLGKPVSYVNVPPDAARQAMLQQGIPAWFVEDLLQLMEAFASGYGAPVSSAVEEVTGQPARTFDRFARDFAGAFRAQPVAGRDR